MVGFHPEGTRNKTDDPYTLLPAQPGIGQMVHRAKPIVMPLFVLGLTNNFPKQVSGNFTGEGSPITVVFGPPVDLEKELAEAPRLRTYMKIAHKLRDTLTELGREEREWRASLGLPYLGPPAPTSTIEA